MFKFKEDRKKISILEEKIKELETKIKKEQDYKISVSFLLDEAIPLEATARKRYMADVALFYGTVFKEKLKHFIGMQQEELSQVGRSEKANEQIRMNINCFRLIDSWMEKHTNEHFGTLEEMRKEFGDNKEFISNFKKIYGEN